MALRVTLGMRSPIEYEGTHRNDRPPSPRFKQATPERRGRYNLHQVLASPLGHSNIALLIAQTLTRPSSPRDLDTPASRPFSTSTDTSTKASTAAPSKRWTRTRALLMWAQCERNQPDNQEGG
jgi:hypothetical protein